MEISDEIHALCQRYQALALSEDEQRLTIALHGEIPAALVSALRFATGKSVGIEQWPVAQLEQAQNQRQSLALVPPPENTEERPPSLNDDSDTPVVQFINQTLRSAIQRRASDVHFEPYQQRFRVRLRIDGVAGNRLSALFAGGQDHCQAKDHGATGYRRAPPATGRPTQCATG